MMMSANKSKPNGTVNPVRTVGKGRPSLTRAETIDSCNSDDLVTVLEVHDRKPYKIMDRRREVKKGVMAESLEELIERGKEKLNYPLDKSVYVVLEEDGTEVDEEEYFQTLPDNTLLMLLHIGDKWSPFGPPFTYKKRFPNAITHESSLPDPGYPLNLSALLDRLFKDPSDISLLSGKELELLAELNPDCYGNCHKFSIFFLAMVQKAARKQSHESKKICDALDLLKIHQEPKVRSRKLKGDKK